MPPLLIDDAVEHHVFGKVLSLFDLVGLLSEQLSCPIYPMHEDATELVGDADIVLEDTEACVGEIGKASSSGCDFVEVSLPGIEPLEYLLNGVEKSRSALAGIYPDDIAVRYSADVARRRADADARKRKVRVAAQIALDAVFRVFEVLVDGDIEDVAVIAILVDAEQNGVFEIRLVWIRADDLANYDIVKLMGDGVQIEFQDYPRVPADYLYLAF